ncbi:MFS transporter [Pseudomonas sp. CFBP 13710]|uniref:MFS transporter n=2 Tax=unclassified Pseudomonas TaxID=196821 RepID=UPI00313E69C3
MFVSIWNVLTQRGNNALHKLNNEIGTICLLHENPDMRNRPLLILMLMLSALDLASTGAFYFSLSEIKSFYGVSELELNMLIFPPTIIAIILISQNCRFIDSLGRRKFLRFFLSVYVLGCAIGLVGENFMWLLTARCIMAIGAAAFVTTARSLTFELHSSDERMRGVNYYASGLALGMALGPFIASSVPFGRLMQAGFVVFGLTALACLVINELTIEPSNDFHAPAQSQYQSQRSMAAMLSPIVMLLIMLTFAPSLYREMGTATTLVLIGATWSIYTGGIILSSSKTHKFSIYSFWRKSRAFRLGITAFSLCFLVIGFNSFYIFNILKDSSQITWGTLGSAYSTGFLSSLIAWLVMYHLLPRTQGSKPFWMTGVALFGLYLVILVCITNGYGGVKAFALGAAVLGVASMFVLASTSMLTFRDLQQNRHEFGHALQIKNVLSQFFTLIGVIASQIVFLH